MRLPNQRFPALRKRISRPIIGPIVGVFSLSLIFIAGCASGTSGMSRVTDFFSSATPEETPVPIPAEAPTPIAAAPTQSTSPSEEEATGHPGKKTVKQARAASENAAAASKAAANASAAAALASKQAATASKQAASVANQIQGSGPTNADVSLETGLGATEDTQTSDIRSRATPAATAVGRFVQRKHRIRSRSSFDSQFAGAGIIGVARRSKSRESSETDSGHR